MILTVGHHYRRTGERQIGHTVVDDTRQDRRIKTHVNDVGPGVQGGSSASGLVPRSACVNSGITNCNVVEIVATSRVGRIRVDVPNCICQGHHRTRDRQTGVRIIDCARDIGREYCNAYGPSSCRRVDICGVSAVSGVNDLQAVGEWSGNRNHHLPTHACTRSKGRQPPTHYASDVGAAVSRIGKGRVSGHHI